MLEEADRYSVVDELYVWYVTDRTRSGLVGLVAHFSDKCKARANQHQC